MGGIERDAVTLMDGRDDVEEEGGIGTGMGGNGWRSTGEGKRGYTGDCTLQRGQGYCIWNATAEDEDTMGE